MEIIVKDNIRDFTRSLSDIQKKQIPFATSRALNDSAVAAQTAIVQGITNKFDNKKRWWLKQQPTGIKVLFSNKAKLRSAIFTNVYFAKRQEEGGLKTPKNGKNIAVPTIKVIRKYRTSHGAKEIMADNKKVFATQKGIFKRTGKTRYPIQLLWSLSPATLTKPRFAFYETCRTTVSKNFNRLFSERLKQALATARK